MSRCRYNRRNHRVNLLRHLSGVHGALVDAVRQRQRRPGGVVPQHAPLRLRPVLPDGPDRLCRCQTGQQGGAAGALLRHHVHRRHLRRHWTQLGRQRQALVRANVVLSFFPPGGKFYSPPLPFNRTLCHSTKFGHVEQAKSHTSSVQNHEIQ